MTVKELKNILNNFNDIDKRKITSAFGKDFEAVVIATNNKLKGWQISWKKYK